MRGPPASTTAHRSPRKALSIAILFQKNGERDDAEELYRRLREVAPDHPGVLHFARVSARQPSCARRAGAVTGLVVRATLGVRSR
jgi:hypothetical protein